jgi:flavorubredoxin
MFMKNMELAQGIQCVGSLDWDRRLFDSLIPLPDGTSYNSYLINGREKIALVDTVNPTKQDELIEKLHESGVEKIDYVISHHAEQDHAGAIPKVLERYPEAKVVSTTKGKEILTGLLPIPEDKFITVADRQKIDLGGKTLEFIHAPWVHWPETMLTYLKEDGILFSCDLFGSHLATSDLYAIDEAKVYESAKRYYAEIMMPFRAMIKSHLEKLKAFEIKKIAPSHGPVYNKPNFILDAYRDWTSDDVKNETLIVYVSMHGSTERMTKHLTEALIERNITVKEFNLEKTDVGELAMALVDAASIVLASPTVLAGAHPQMIYAAYLANLLRPKLKTAALIGSYSWGTNITNQITGMLPNLKVELLEPVLIKGLPKEADFKALDALADSIAEKHGKYGILK